MTTTGHPNPRRPGIARRVGLVAALAAALPLAACGAGSNANKAGAESTRTAVLRLEMPDAGDALGLYFTSAVARRSHGSVHLKIDSANTYTSFVPANEVALARALRAGREQIGYLPARAFAADGLMGFAALQTPFGITTAAAAQRAATSAVARRVLASLPSSLVGIALVPAEPRSVLSAAPPTSTAAFAALRVRIVDNPQTDADLRALGAEPVQGLSSSAAATAIRRKEIDAVESSPSNILTNGYQAYLHQLSSYALFPKFEAVVVSRSAWAKLSAAQQAAVRAAAADTVAAAGQKIPAGEQAALAQLCAQNVTVATPTARDLAAMQTASAGIVATLAVDPVAKGVIDAINALPDAGPHPEAVPVPSACRTPAAAAASGKGAATIPTGTYVVTDTAQDFINGNVTDPDFKQPITYTTVFSKNGTWYQTQKPNFPDQGPFWGTYVVNGDRVTITMTKAGQHAENNVSAPEIVQWSYFDGALHLKNILVSDTGSRVLYAAHPWRKIR